MSNDSDRHQLLAIVAAVHHQRVGEALDNRTLCFPETLDCESAGRVGYIDRLADLDVVAVSSILSQ
jgi:hypothetical protein